MGKNKSYAHCQPLVFAEKHLSGDNKKCAHPQTRVFAQSHGSNHRLCHGTVDFCSLLSLFVCISVCCAERPVSPLCNHWSLLASYPLNISVFVGRLWGGILTMSLDLSQELQIMQCVCIYEKKREFVCLFLCLCPFVYL